MINHILITGGNGLLGKQLTAKLLEKGYSVCHLSRSLRNQEDVKTFIWDIKKGTIDPDCIKGVDAIIHLAGAGIADEKWSDERKRELLETRTKSIGLIYNLLKTKQHQVTSVISASATGYYGDSGDKLMTEESPSGTDFLAECCRKWEQAVDEAVTMELRVVKFRTGVVLTELGGALPKLAAPIKFGFGTVLGSGRQWTPWIHYQDVIDMYVMAVENGGLTGVYNMVAPFPVTNEELTHAVANALDKPLWLPHVPALVLKMVLGEMSSVVLNSNKVSPQKIEKEGFHFQFLTIDEALKDIYRKRWEG